MNEIVIAVIILAIIVAIILSGRKHRMVQAESHMSSNLEQKEAWAQESVMSYNEVQEIRKNLITSVEERYTDRHEDQERLKEIINDWADLKIRAFQERRSWVRRPGKGDQEG